MTKQVLAAGGQHLLELLADGQLHSGEALAASLGVSRAAVWKRIKALRSLELEITSEPGKGYRLPYRLEFLNREDIEAGLLNGAREDIQNVEILHSVDSTNRYLLNKLAGGSIHGQVCLAEFQSAGRGRRARRWVAPYGSGLCMSLGWDFGAEPAALTALGLAVAVGVARVLDNIGVAEVGIKWPNDIFHKNKKLGGILIDLQTQGGGPAHTVIGIGINFSLPPELVATLGEKFRQPWTDLRSAVDKPLSRNQVVASLLNELVPLLSSYQDAGFGPLRSHWQRYDYLTGRDVELDMSGKLISGSYQGVDSDGALILSLDGRLGKYFSGDVSVTPL
jgi:BirA family biotin operon repressor/biotin-[acetyl-CoA-carboxylase] ligase